jgi:pimeloyl-ACP methyl ester carboxylesterase
VPTAAASHERGGSEPGRMPLLPLSLLVLTAIVVGGPLLVPASSSTSLSPPRDLADPDSRFATLAGLEVHHKVAGDPQHPAVVLHHHFYGNVFTWRHVQAGLQDDHHVAAFDRPGFGLTERPPRERWGEHHPYTRRTSARITLDLLDRLGAQDAVLVGSSAGGTTALETYALAPERVRALVLVSPAITGDVGPPAALRPLLRSPQAQRLGPHLVERFAGEVTLERIARSWHDPTRATDDDLDAYTRPLRVERWQHGFVDLFGAEPPPNLTGLLQRVEVPTLVVTGASDRVISPTWNRRTAAAIPGARFEVLPDCGHTPQEECPDAFLEVLRSFLDDLPATEGASG